MGSKQFSIYQGDALTITCTVKDNDGNVLNLTNYDGIHFTVKTNKESPTLIIHKTLGAGITVISAVKGILQVKLLNDDSKEIEPDRYYYEIMLEDTSEDLQYVVVQDFVKVVGRVLGYPESVPGDFLVMGNFQVGVDDGLARTAKFYGDVIVGSPTNPRTFTKYGSANIIGDLDDDYALRLQSQGVSKPALLIRNMADDADLFNIQENIGAVFNTHLVVNNNLTQGADDAVVRNTYINAHLMIGTLNNPRNFILHSSGDVGNHTVIGNNLTASYAPTFKRVMHLCHKFTPNASSSQFGCLVNIEVAETAGDNQSTFAGYFRLDHIGNVSITSGMTALTGTFSHSGSVNIATATGVYGYIYQNGTGVISNGYALYSAIVTTVGKVIDNGYGLLIRFGGSGTITNYSGIYLEGMSSTTINFYGLRFPGLGHTIPDGGKWYWNFAAPAIVCGVGEEFYGTYYDFTNIGVGGTITAIYIKGKVGILGADLVDASIRVTGNGQYMQVPVMLQANRPSVPVKGMIIFNDTTGHYEGWTGATWEELN